MSTQQSQISRVNSRSVDETLVTGVKQAIVYHAASLGTDNGGENGAPNPVVAVMNIVSIWVGQERDTNLLSESIHLTSIPNHLDEASSMRNLVFTRNRECTHGKEETRAQITSRVDGIRSLHTPRHSDTQDEEQENERYGAAWGREIALVAESKHNDKQHGRAQEL